MGPEVLQQVRQRVVGARACGEPREGGATRGPARLPRCVRQRRRCGRSDRDDRPAQERALDPRRLARAPARSHAAARGAQGPRGGDESLKHRLASPLARDHLHPDVGHAGRVGQADATLRAELDARLSRGAGERHVRQAADDFEAHLGRSVPRRAGLEGDEGRGDGEHSRVSRPVV